jgi:hypothetical protein
MKGHTNGERSMTDQPDRPHRPPADDESQPSEPAIRAPGAEDVDEMRAPRREGLPNPDDPPGQNAPVGKSGGAGMGNPDNDQPDLSREGFRDRT